MSTQLQSTCNAFHDSNLRYWAFTFHDFDYCHPVQKSDCHPTQTWLPFQLIAKHDCHPTHPLHPVFTMVLPAECSTDWWRPKTSLGMQPLPSSHTHLTPLIRSEWFCKITKYGNFCFDNRIICQREWFDCDHGSWWWLTFTWKISLWTQPLPSRGACSNPSAIDKTRENK